MIPIKVIPTCTEERKFSGFSSNFRTVTALEFPCAAKCSIRLFFTETKAISEREKKPFKMVKKNIMSISMFL